jgi:Bacteriophage holin of superfamily 6 (Holin_LLH)
MSMSPSMQMALVLLPIVLPLLISLSAVLYQHLLQSLPEKRRVEIDQVVHKVVLAVEQASTALEGPAKKEAAMEMATSILAYLHISVPQEILSCLIEAAVYSLQQNNMAPASADQAKTPSH